MNPILVTGGAGFIGSTVVRQLLARDETVVVLDALTYCGRRENLSDLFHLESFTFIHGSINDPACLAEVLARHAPRSILNLAAETHVDRSIDAPADFVSTNIGGTHNLLAAARCYWESLRADMRRRFRFVQVSTDEVYGSISHDPAHEGAPLAANSPYAASKAGADLLARAYFQTFGFPVIVTRGCNSYGPRQFPEKLIPLLILRGLSGVPLPIYGDGRQVREWVHVDDAAAGILAALDRGEPGEVYNLGSSETRENIELARTVCGLLDDLTAAAPGTSAARIAHTDDRPGHDRRYNMDCSKAAHALGWRASTPFQEGLARTVRWYLSNEQWWSALTRERYDLRRLGAPSTPARAHAG